MLDKLKNFYKKESIIIDEQKPDDTEFLENKFDFRKHTKHVFSKNIKLASILIVAIIVLAVNLSFILKKIVDTQALKTFLENEISQTTGKKVVIDGDIELEITPEAQVRINDLKIIDDVKIGSESFTELKNIHVRPKLLELFIGRISFDNINIESATVFFKKPLNTENNFKSCLKKIANMEIGKYSNKIKNVNIKNFALKYIKGDENKIYQREFNANDVILNFEQGFDFTGKINGLIDLNGSISNNSENNFQAQLFNDQTNLSLNGTLNYKDSFKFTGVLNGKVKNLETSILKLFFPDKDFSRSLSQNNEYDVKSDVYFNENNLILPNLKFSSDFFNSTMKFGLVFADQLSFITDMEVSDINLKKFFPDGSDFFMRQFNKNSLLGKSNSFVFSLNDDIKFSAKINILNIAFDKIKANGSTRFDLIGSDLNISYFDINLPGDTILHLSSNLKIDKEKKVFTGSSDLSFISQNPTDLFAAYDPNKDFTTSYLPKLIALKSNIYNYEGKLHFRKIDVAFDDNKSVGQLVIDYSDKKIIGNSAFNFSSINLDKISSSSASGDTADLLRKLDYVRYVDSLFDVFNISVQAGMLTYNRVNYTDASSFLTVSNGKIYFNQLQMSSDEFGQINGKFDIELSLFQPKLNMEMQIDNYSIGENSDPILTGTWLDKNINLEKYSLVTGSSKFRIDNVKLYGMNLKNFYADLSSTGDKITINKGRFDISDGKFDMQGEVTTEFPSLSLSFTATNLDINSFLDKTINNDSITGNVNLSGNIGMNGANVAQWVKSLKGTINFTSTGIKYTGIDVANLSEKISTSNKIRDVRSWSDKYLSSGNTIFNYLNGTVNIDKGIFEIDELALNNQNIRTGKFYTKYDFNSWTADSVLDLNVKTTNQAQFGNNEFPVQISYKGNINNPVINRDIKGIEKYWENKFYSR